MHCTSPEASSPGSFRPGFTLVEVMVAVVVLGLGLTLLAGVSARAIRLVHRGRSDLAVAIALTDRLERLRASVISAGCGAGSAGMMTLPGGRRESWVVAPVAGSVRLVDSVIPPGADSGSATVFGATVPCP
jgi:prepilin-type N-terminal cleavage/methylation domain-containing protein